MDQTTCEEVKSLIRVLSVADVRGLDSDHLEHGLEDWCSDVGVGWETDDDDGTSWSDVFGSLLEWLLVDSDQDDGMWAKTISSSGSDVLRHIAGGGEVDECLSGISLMS